MLMALKFLWPCSSSVWWLISSLNKITIHLFWCIHFAFFLCKSVYSYIVILQASLYTWSTPFYFHFWKNKM
jgi:hypothetical protein